MKTYILVRQDLPVITQLVQASHAAFEMGRRPCMDNYQAEYPMVVLAVPDAWTLRQWAARVSREGIACELFWECDGDLGCTALCTEPTDTQLFRHLRLLRA